MLGVSLAVDPITDMDKTSPTSENGRWSGMMTTAGCGGSLMGSRSSYFLADDITKRMKYFFYFCEIPSSNSSN
ncbi:hypothetical protein Bca4012_032961 [Brassica carinata]